MLSVYASSRPNPCDIVTLARKELRQDRLFPLLSAAQEEEYLALALEIGRDAAVPYVGQKIPALAARLGVRIEECAGDARIHGSATYAEYDAASRLIRIYRAGERLLAAHLAQCLPAERAQETARSLLIAHELFHHLEATQLGPTHRRLPPVSVPICGPRWRVKRYLLRTREIAAHAFAYTLLGLTEPFPA